jgi:hypothetical protein
MVRQMVVPVRGRIHNDRRMTMRFVRIGGNENGLGTIVRAATGVGVGGNDKQYANTKHKER